MANIMIRRSNKGDYVFYLPKRDLEDTIVSMEFDTRKNGAARSS